MMHISRRDFLKVSSSVSGAALFSKLTTSPSARRADEATTRPNIIVLVLDAMSAKNLSLYGYHRQTTPNFERFAQRATVFQQHYSTGNFTTPGTASLLTGLFPWSHRAINLSGLIARERVHENLFAALGESYFRFAFSQNVLPLYLLDQFHGDLDEIRSPASFSILDSFVSASLGAGWMDADRAIEDLLFQEGHGTGSLVFGLAERLRRYRAVASAETPDYSGKLPHTSTPVFYQLKDVFNGLMGIAESLPRPFLAYLHMWAPHYPYVPSKEFEGKFLDGWEPEPKRSHRLVDPRWHHSARILNENRRMYDEYVANVDHEFGRWYDSLRQSGILDSSYVIVTSDHGEMFERGVLGHETALLYDAVVRVPLMVSAPGQASRLDVEVPTSSVDLLPTLVHAAGGTIPAWCEGRILPGLGGPTDDQQSLYMMEAKDQPPRGPLTTASFALRKGRYKLIDYMGYPAYRVKHRFELYDLESDPEEINDIYSETLSAAWSMREELLARIETFNGHAGPP
jgi:arylsulfatase A-like enzyme